MQLRKHREKLREMKGERSRATAAAAGEEDSRALPPIRRFRVEVPTLDLADAVNLLRTKKSDILVFSNINSGALSILYRRADGGFALAEPELG